MSQSQYIAWISILQAIMMVFIVAGHVDLAGDFNPAHPIATWIDRLVQFHLPTFFFISGYLYMCSSLSKKAYVDMLKSKWTRLAIPYLFMSFVFYALKLLLPADELSRPAELSFGYVCKFLLEPWNGPARHLWFLFSLFTFFVLMPIYEPTPKSRIKS